MTAQSADLDQQKLLAYQRLFNPKSIAVIGASNDALKPGGRVIKNIKEHGYQGELWAVNLKTKDVLGLPTFPTIADLPAAPELALVAIPAPFVLPAMEELASLKTGAVIVLTAGFGEKNQEGKQLEQKMRLIADETGMVMIGPNCSGFLTNTYKGKFAGIIPTLPGRAVDFISGSGATVDYVMERASGRGISFGTVINLGNSVQMGVEDLLELHDLNYGPDSAPLLMLYMESVKKPQKLLKHARSLAAKGCILVGIKSGATEAGERAAASHTGAMATSDTAVAALFKKAGVIRVPGRGDLINVAGVMISAGGRPKGKRVCIITDAGGPGVMLSDELARQGMQVPLLSEKTRAELAKILPPEASTLNPIDALPSRTAPQIEGIIKTLGQYEAANIDLIAICTGDSGLSDNAEIYQAISEARKLSPIPIVPVLSSVISSRGKIAAFVEQGNVAFPDEVELGRAIGLAAGWSAPQEAAAPPQDYDRQAIAAALGDKAGALDPATVAEVLGAAGFQLPRQMEVFQQSGLAAACREAGYPVALKVIGPLHKTDLGGVKLGIADAAAADAAWGELMAIHGAEGVLVQPMIEGLEVILGASREGDFGHLVMFGLGGIHAEVLKDVQFALAPLSADEAMDMLNGIRGRALLDGVRGGKGMDTGVLAGNLQRLGRLVADFPQIKEIDLNPLKGADKRLFAVDARIIVQKEGA